MAEIIPTGFAQVNLLYAGSSLPRGAQVTFGVIATGTPDPVDLANDVKDAYVAANMYTALPNTRALVRINVTMGPRPTGAIGTIGVNIPGTDSDTANTPAVAVLVKKSTGVGGRKNSGRLYLPGVSENEIGPSGVLSSSTMSSIQGQVTDFLSELAIRSIGMTLLHSVAGATPTPITQLVVDSIVATQRRRQRRL